MNYQAAPNRYESMHYRRCGRSGIQLPTISLGLWHNFGDSDVFSVGRETLLYAFDRGITHFDLANNYGPPIESAERTFGRVLSADLGQYRHELFISTKAGFSNRPGPYGEFCSRKALLGSLDQSLVNMGLDYVDVFYSHRFDPETPLEETVGALDQAVRSGKALYAGLSNYPVEALEEAVGLLKGLKTPCLVDQVCYNMLHREMEEARLEVLKRLQVGCVVFSPLAQGQLTDRYVAGIPQGSRATKSESLSEDSIQGNQAKIAALHSIAQKREQSLSAMAIAWVFRHPEITSAIVGASSKEQLENTLEALDCLEFSEDELLDIEKALQL